MRLTGNQSIITQKIPCIGYFFPKFLVVYCRMKKTISISFLLVIFCFSFANSQTINGVPLKEVDVEFVQIVGTAKLLSTQLSIQIDFGQRTKLFTANKETLLRDEQGNPLILNSMMDALNFMSKNGYDFLDAYALTNGSQNVYHFLLQKRKE